MLLQDLHDSHVCNSLLVAESEEEIWKNESLYRQRLNTSDGECGGFICPPAGGSLCVPEQMNILVFGWKNTFRPLQLCL